jgi:hypothetical protein
MDLDIILGMD